jgi:hypothetical protein
MDVADEIVLLTFRRKNFASVRVYIYAYVLAQLLGNEERTKGKIVARGKSKSRNLVAGVGGFEPGGQPIQREPFRSRLDVRPWIEPAIDLVFKDDEAAGDSQQSEEERRGQAATQMQIQKYFTNRHGMKLTSRGVSDRLVAHEPRAFCGDLRPFADVEIPSRADDVSDTAPATSRPPAACATLPEQDSIDTHMEHLEIRILADCLRHSPLQ